MRVVRRIAFVFAVLVSGAAFAADRELGGFIDVSLRPDYLASVAGEDETFVGATSTSSYELSVVDATLNEELAFFELPALAGSRARGIAGTPDAADPDDRILATITNDGYVDFFFVTDLEALTQAGVEPDVNTHKADADGEPLSGIALDSLGANTFAGVPADETVGVNNIASGALTGTIQIGHAPVTAVTLNTGFLERAWFGCDDGFLAWVDTGSFSPGATAAPIDGDGDPIGALAVADFGGGALRLLAVDTSDDILYVVDAGTASVIDSVALGADVVAVAASGSGSTARIWVAIADATNGHRIEGLDTSLAEAQADVTLPSAPLSLAERGGRLYVGLADGRVAVVTDQPFVTITAVTPDPLTEDDGDVTVGFVSSQSGTARVFLNGTQVDSLSVTAGQAAQVAIPGSDVEDVIDLGLNRVRVDVSNAGGLVGVDEEVLVFDEAPGAPRNFEVGFGNGRVIGRWDAPAGASDVDYYLVYFGLFLGDTSGTPQQDSPAQEDGHEFVVDVENGTEVCMSVAAVDSGGNMSSRTSAQCATAQPTVGAADLAGDEGGFLCSVAALERRAAPFFAALLLAIGALAARRLRSASGGAIR